MARMAAIIDAINDATPTASATFIESDLGPDMSIPDMPDMPDIPSIDIPAIAFDLPLDPGEAVGSGIDIPGIDIPGIDIPDIPGIDIAPAGVSITTGAGCAGSAPPGAARSIHRTTVPSL
jgi:hypothetical protein